MISSGLNLEFTAVIDFFGISSSTDDMSGVDGSGSVSSSLLGPGIFLGRESGSVRRGGGEPR